MIHINNRSDFSIVWKMPNGGILPTFPYTLEFSTRGGLRYAVKSDDATRFIPKPDADGQIRSAIIVFDFSNRPHLPSGRLMFTMQAAIPNTMYPDDYQDITEPHPTNAELWDGATDYKDAVEVELVLPYVKGDAGKGVPAGGRTGQVLKKKSDGDYDTAWGEDEGITNIAPGAVGTDEIADNAVTKGKIGAGAVVADKIAEGAVSRSKLDTDLASRGVRKAWMVNLLYAPSPSGVYKDVTPSEWRAVAGGTVDFTPLDKMVKEAAKAGDFIMNGTNTSYIVLQHIVGLVGGNELHRFVLVRQFASGSQPNTETGISSYQSECVLYDYTPRTNTLKAMSLIFRDAFNDYKAVGGDGNRQKLFETIRDLVDKPISTSKIAEKAVTLPKLGDDVAAKLNGYASKEDVAAVASVATSAASAAADAQTLADDAANDAQTAVNTANDAKTAAESAQTAASGAVRFDAAQGLTVAEMEQALLNLGLKFMVITPNEIGKVLNEEQQARLASCDALLFNSTSIHMILIRGDNTSGHTKFVSLVDSSRYYEVVYNKSTHILSNVAAARIIDSNAVRYNVSQTITSAQQERARKNIDAMANTPSGDPMHYMYETAGAEWIPYADISTEGLEDWQVETLDRTQAQADGGVWWHNDIFVTVEQNRINYVLTIGYYPTQLSTYNLYLTSSTATTNYKEYNKSGFSPISASDACRSTLCKTIYFPQIMVTSFLRSFSNNSRLCRILGILNISPTNTSISGILSNSPNLRDVQIKGLNSNVDLYTNINLSVASIAYAITNAGTATFTITLAPAVYAAAMADADVQAALAAKPNVTLANAGATGGEN